ncbi:MAG: cytochrome c biogenesis protein CcsA [Bacteroidota bacterium]
MEINYIGEELFWGKAGNFLLILAFTSALLSVVCYLFSTFAKSDTEISSWKKLARSSFYIHGISVLAVVALIFFLIHQHRFEYYYVWQHSSTILPLKYMWACFWEGQEGSFLLWTFWHAVLAFIIIRSAGKWEMPVLSIIMLVQVFLCSMVLGLQLGDVKIGSNPFILLRNHPDFASLPFIHMPDYLSKIKDGRGLNPLLQNYWMVIHPPTLFLGFASTVVPFAFGMAGLMKKNAREWIRPALPWTFFSIMILGTGILMGGAWAYEALSFGGFWAWDPVENASLVPWLTLVAAAHVMLINIKNGKALLSSFLLITFTFVLVLYSTFLTRSGILGDTSVHAFTDLGMTGQLLIYMLFFIVLAVWLIIKNYKIIKGNNEEEHLLSREFWMFIGALVLVISAVQIIFTTSLPVVNKLFDSNLAPPAEAISFYNSWQVPIASIIALLMAVGQFFKYRQTAPRDIYIKLLPSIILSLAAAICIHLVFDFARWQYVMLLFCAIFAFAANADYFIRIIKGKTSHSGASIAHMGIAFIMLGALISNAEQIVISRNNLNVDLGKDFPNQENILLYKGDTLPMGEYYIKYSGKEKEGVNIFYNIDYFKADHKSGKFNKEFTLKPIVQINERMGNVSEPATKRFLSRDIYTHITYANLENLDEHEKDNDYSEFKMHDVAVGDTLTASNALIVVEALNKNVDKKALLLNDNDIAVGVQLKVIDVNKSSKYVEPIFIIKGQTTYTKEAELELLGLRFSFNNILPESGKIQIGLSEKKNNSREFIIMKAIIFPQINILWTGCLLMIIGTWITIIKRRAQLKTVKS